LTARTSISDEESYTAICSAAAARDDVFRSFKREPAYRRVLEHVTPDQGLEYLRELVRCYPFLEQRLDEFRVNDALGAPLAHDYGPPIGTWSPTTLRYAKVAGDLVTMFGPLEGADIVEIGAGYGGQCLVLSRLVRWRSYTIYDLPAAQALQRRYLAAFGVPAVSFEPFDPLRARDSDLAISNYAFSECERRIQDRYIEQLLRRARWGYLTCNVTADFVYTEAELRARLPGAVRLPEAPLLHVGNYLLAWNRDRTDTNGPAG
jgi:hypothetical protein